MDETGSLSAFGQEKAGGFYPGLEGIGYELDINRHKRRIYMGLDKRDELLLLIAVSGEIPADWIGIAVGSESYGAALITRLKKEGMLRQRKKDGLWGYLLSIKAKRYLLDRYREDVEMYLGGASSTNHVKSELDKRLRLHRMSMVWIFCRKVGIGVFFHQKPALPWEMGRETKEEMIWEKSEWAAYYGTTEWKRPGDLEIKGSRACGLLMGSHCYIVYNTMDRLMKWVPKIERNLAGRLEIRMRKCGSPLLTGAIFFGMSMKMLLRLLESEGGIKGNLFALDDVYEHYYYIPLKMEAWLQLRLLCDDAANRRLMTFLGEMLKKIQKEERHLEDGWDRNDRPVYFCYLMDLRKLSRILKRPMLRPGKLVCFSYQAQALKAIFPEPFLIQALEPEKVAQYLGWKEIRS